MKKIIVTMVCAMSAMLALAVQYPTRHYTRPLIRLHTSQRMTAENGSYYTPLSQIDEQAFRPLTGPVSSRYGVYEGGCDNIPEDMMYEQYQSSYTAISAYAAGVAAAESAPEEDHAGSRAASGPRRITIGGGTWEGDDGDEETYDWSGSEKGGTYRDNHDGTYTFFDAEGNEIGTYEGVVTPDGFINLGEVVRNPIGSPILPFLLFAMMACGVIYYRRRKVAIA